MIFFLLVPLNAHIHQALLSDLGSRSWTLHTALQKRPGVAAPGHPAYVGRSGGSVWHTGDSMIPILLRMNPLDL